MDRKIRIFSVLAVVFIFGIYGTAWAGGGIWEGCKPPAAPYFGPLIDGSFTVTRHGELYQIHAVLRMDKDVREVSYTDPRITISLCAYTDEALEENHKCDPFGNKVGEMFGLPGLPVFEPKTLKITSRNCKDEQKAEISGTVKVRVVP